LSGGIHHDHIADAKRRPRKHRAGVVRRAPACGAAGPQTKAGLRQERDWYAMVRVALLLAMCGVVQGRECAPVSFNAEDLTQKKTQRRNIVGELCVSTDRDEGASARVTVGLEMEENDAVFYGFKLPNNTYYGFRLGNVLEEADQTTLAAIMTKNVAKDSCTLVNGSEDISPCHFVRRTPLGLDFPKEICISSEKYEEYRALGLLANRNVCRLAAEEEPLEDPGPEYQAFEMTRTSNGELEFTLAPGVELPSSLEVIYGAIVRTKGKYGGDVIAAGNEEGTFGNSMTFELAGPSGNNPGQGSSNSLTGAPENEETLQGPQIAPVLGDKGTLQYEVDKNGLVRFEVILKEGPDFQGFIGLGVSEGQKMPGSKVVVASFDGETAEFKQYSIDGYTAGDLNQIVDDEFRRLQAEESGCSGSWEEINGQVKVQLCTKSIAGKELIGEDGALLPLVLAYGPDPSLSQMHAASQVITRTTTNFTDATLGQETSSEPTPFQTPTSAPVESIFSEESFAPTFSEEFGNETDAPSFFDEFENETFAPTISIEDIDNSTIAPSVSPTLSTLAPTTTPTFSEVSTLSPTSSPLPMTDAPTRGGTTLAPTPAQGNETSSPTHHDTSERALDLLNGKVGIRYSTSESGQVTMQVTLRDEPMFSGFLGLGISETMAMVGTKAIIITKEDEVVSAGMYSVEGYTADMINKKKTLKIEAQPKKRRLEEASCGATSVEQAGDDVVLTLCRSGILGEKLVSNDGALKPFVVAYGYDAALRTPHSISQAGAFNPAAAEYYPGATTTLTGATVAALVIGVLLSITLLGILYAKFNQKLDDNDEGEVKCTEEPSLGDTRNKVPAESPTNSLARH